MCIECVRIPMSPCVLRALCLLGVGVFWGWFSLEGGALEHMASGISSWGFESV